MAVLFCLGVARPRPDQHSEVDGWKRSPSKPSIRRLTALLDWILKLPEIA
jgi:hypothetical protein